LRDNPSVPRARGQARPRPDHYSSRTYWTLRKIVKQQEPNCAICGLPWDPHAAPRTPRSFTLDHITPMSRGGSLTDRSNVRAAHYSCNARRGAGLRRKPAQPAQPAGVVQETCTVCGDPRCRRATGYVSRCWYKRIDLPVW
jgi:5-methylcytosine-specific restriction endonuclease McrA